MELGQLEWRHEHHVGDPLGVDVREVVNRERPAMDEVVDKGGPLVAHLLANLPQEAPPLP